MNIHFLLLIFLLSEVVASKKQLSVVFAQRNRPKQGVGRAERRKATTMRRWRDVHLTARKKLNICLYSSLAQSVEHLTVNQVVAGSSPAGGAKATSKEVAFFVVMSLLQRHQLNSQCLLRKRLLICYSSVGHDE